MNQKIHCSIVIPFKNEEKNLEILLPKLARVISKYQIDVELFLVDDFSNDKSLIVCERSKSLFENIKILKLNYPSGQTGAFKAAFNESKGEYLIRMDADLQDDPEDLPLFFEKFKKGSELVMGLRECRKHSRILRLTSILYDSLILLMFNTPLHSNSGSYVGFKSHLVKNIPWRKNDHRYLPLIAIRRGARNIGEVIVRHNPRIYGSSKYKPFKKIFFGIWEVIQFLIRLKRGKYDLK